MPENYVNLPAADIMLIAENVSFSGVDEPKRLCYNPLATKNAGIAQSVEQLIRNQQVVCSSHITSSIIKSPIVWKTFRLWVILFIFNGI